MKHNLIFLLLSSFIVSSAVHAEQVGTIKYARGAITVQNEDGSSTRLTGKGGAINEGEVIKTGPKSFAIISLDDETRMTIRPRSSFAVQEYTAEKNARASALLRLFRGGLRTVTGFISKFNPKGYKIKTPVATIGIRGTEFDARLCEEDDCNNENKKITKRNREQGKQPVAKIVFMRGAVKAENFRDEMRALSNRAAIYEGDTIITEQGAYAVVVFRDRSRVSLQELTQFRVDELRYSKEAEKGSSALFSLLRGGLRAVSGLIGKVNPASYRTRTTVATIGIRGTGYDLICTGECAVDKLKSKKQLPNGDGLYSTVTDGSITMGDLLLSVNDSGFQKNSQSAPEKLAYTLDLYKGDPTPAPNSIEVDEDALFADVENEKVSPGLYVSVKDGKVTLDNNVTKDFVEITKNQAAFAGLQGNIKQLPSIPAFQAQDIFPTPDNFSPKSVYLGSDIGSKDDEGLCEVK